MAEWLRLCRAGSYVEAAAYLDLGEDLLDRGPELTRRLKAVLDHYSWVDVQTLPREVPERRDVRARTLEIARIPIAAGASQPVVIAGEGSGESLWWHFTRDTVDSIDAWYSTLRNRWLIDILPAPLLRRGPAHILYWQWASLLALLVGGWIAALVLARLSQASLKSLAKRTKPPWDDRIVANLFGPLALLWLLALLAIGVPFLGLFEPSQKAIFHLLRLGFLFAVLWTVVRAASELGAYLHQSDWALASPDSRALIPLGVTLTKLVVFTVAVLTILIEMGYSVSSVVAGLGIGGLALAFGAQKTIENLFGALSIGLDQPFRAGDYVKVEDFAGNVELIGLRSTSVRTLDRTLITIPNGKLAEMKIESMAARDRFRFATTLNLTYGTTPDQLRAVLADMEAMLRADARVWPELVQVAFTQLSSSSLDVEIMAWLVVKDWEEFLRVRQELLLRIMDVVAGSGSGFAFPTRTVHITGARLPEVAATASPGAPGPLARP